MIELAPAYTGVAVFFNPITVAKSSGTPHDAFDWLATRIREAVAAGVDRGRRQKSSRSDVRVVEIPVCYHSDFAPDIDVKRPG